ncbi:MAG: MBL fold metallo-hydrolase [Planctomycetota bacterium]|jgi:glyoxylase-like metal-dependent hydrolase (beta-lactamase superfamily II)
MIFEQIKAGGDRNFGYLVGDEESKKAAIVDPSTDPGAILKRVEAHGLNVVYVFNTHGHIDHTSGNQTVLSKTGAELVRGEDGRKLELGSVALTVIHTPGHSTDSLCVLAEASGAPGKLMTGDTLFVGKVGGTGFGQDARDEYDSIHRKLLTLPDSTEVWPGHDYGVKPASTVGHEKKTNPFLLRETFEDFVDLKRNWLQYKKEHGIA